jgi:hypothetical protein
MYLFQAKRERAGARLTLEDTIILTALDSFGWTLPYTLLSSVSLPYLGRGGNRNKEGFDGLSGELRHRPDADRILLWL